MGVTYKLRDEVVHFIISQRQGNPFSSCRQLAEEASQKFGLRLSKSSVHDVLKESGIVTPRGRKPKNKFEIPQEKKKQIQESLSQVKLLPPPVEIQAVISNEVENRALSPIEKEIEISSEYEGAGKIFFKAALWDLGIFSEDSIKERDWDYYLTYTKGVKVVLENNKSFFIDLPLPIERCIREVADGLINNVRPFIVNKISDEALFKACMDAQEGFKIENVSIVDKYDRVLFEINDLVEHKREFLFINLIFVESNEKFAKDRARSIFFSQIIGDNDVIDNILNLEGFDATNQYENTVSLLIPNGYADMMLQESTEKLNGMHLRDERDRLVKVRLSLC